MCRNYDSNFQGDGIFHSGCVRHTALIFDEQDDFCLCGNLHKYRPLLLQKWANYAWAGTRYLVGAAGFETPSEGICDLGAFFSCCHLAAAQVCVVNLARKQKTTCKSFFPLWNTEGQMMLRMFPNYFYLMGSQVAQCLSHTPTGTGFLQYHILTPLFAFVIVIWPQYQWRVLVLSW